jgi:hypothetical protein
VFPAILAGIFGIMFLIPLFLFWRDMPLSGWVVFGGIGIPLTSLMVWYIYKGTKNPMYKWVGPGPPDLDEAPPGMDVGAMEAQRLLNMYGPDPRSPYGQPGNVRVIQSKATSEFIAPPGGGWLITPRELLEDEGEERDVQLHDLGTSWVFEARATAEQMRGVKYGVTNDSLQVWIPTGNDWLADKKLAMDKEGNRLAQIRLHDDVLPNRSWVDLWDGVVRVNMPIDTEYTYDGVDRRELEPVSRGEAPPPLPEVPEASKNKPSIYAMRVDDRGESFEVSISTEHQVRDSFRYKVDGNDLKVEFEEVRRKTAANAMLIRAKRHKLMVRLPQRVLADSTNFRLEGDTFHIYLHKA